MLSGLEGKQSPPLLSVHLGLDAHIRKGPGIGWPSVCSSSLAACASHSFQVLEFHKLGWPAYQSIPISSIPPENHD